MDMFLRAAVDKAREEMMASVEEGTVCPCCKRYIKLYRRHVNKSMVEALEWLVRISEEGRRWVNMSKEAPAKFTKSFQVGTLKYWGLIEQKPAEGNGKARTSATWRPTSSGVRFIRGEMTVPKYAKVLCDKVVGFSDDRVFVHDIVEGFYWSGV
jgi:hypothetical protein